MISAYDSGEPVVSDDLAEKEFDAPEFIQRFKNLMDWVIPLLVEYDGFLISISIEAENFFGEFPNLHKQILSFLLEIKEHIHQINENMAVTAIISEGSLDDYKPGINEILAGCIKLMGNIYTINWEIAEPLSSAI
ncbi:MAG: hypothetical protein ACLFQA_06010 [Bacteroidales bacterium]